MIVYQLRCGNDHEFEAWFLDSATYATQAEAGDVVCPFCGDTHVQKAIMAPNIATKRSGPTDADMGKAEDRAREVAEKILEAVGEIRAQVEANCEDVGDNFADEARRIHYGETEERGIYGNATDDEAEALDEEGIEFYRLPQTRRDS
jgi:hypothetical protein